MSRIDIKSLTKQLQGGRKNTSAPTKPKSESEPTSESEPPKPAPVTMLYAPVSASANAPAAPKRFEAASHMKALSAGLRSSSSKKPPVASSAMPVGSSAMPVGTIDAPSGPADAPPGPVDAAEFRRLQQDVAAILTRLNYVQSEVNNVVSNVACMPDAAGEISQILAIVQGRAPLSEYEPQDDADSLAQANEAVALDMVNNAIVDQFECESDRSEESDDESCF